MAGPGDRLHDRRSRDRASARRPPSSGSAASSTSAPFTMPSWPRPRSLPPRAEARDIVVTGREAARGDRPMRPSSDPAVSADGLRRTTPVKTCSGSGSTRRVGPSRASTLPDRWTRRHAVDRSTASVSGSTNNDNKLGFRPGRRQRLERDQRRAGRGSLKKPAGCRRPVSRPVPLCGTVGHLFLNSGDGGSAWPYAAVLRANKRSRPSSRLNRLVSEARVLVRREWEEGRTRAARLEKLIEPRGGKRL